MTMTDERGAAIDLRTAAPPSAAPRPAIVIDGVTKVYGHAGAAVSALDRCVAAGGRGRVRVPRRRVGMRQEHAAQPGGGTRPGRHRGASNGPAARWR